MLGLDSRSRSGSSRRPSAARSARSSAPTPSTPSSRWAARHARPAGHLGRDALGEHGRDDARPGAAADRDDRRRPRRHGQGLPAARAAGQRRLPAVRRAAADADRADGARRLRHPEARASRSTASSPTPRRSAPTAAPGGPRPPPRSSGRWTCSPPRSAWTRPRCARRNLLPRVHRAATSRGGALYDSGDYPAALRHGARAPPTTTGCAREQAARRERGDAVQLGIGLSRLRRDHRRRRGVRRPERERHRRDPPRRHARPSSPARRRTGRGTRRSWAMLASDGARHPDRADHRQVGRHRPHPRGRRHRRLAQPAAGRRRGAAGRARSWSSSPETRAADELEVDPGDLVVDLGRGRARRSRACPGTGVTFAALAEKERLFVRSVFTAPGRDLPVRRARRRGRGRHRDRQGRAAAPDRPRRRRDDHQPAARRGQRHGGLAQGAAQALLEEVLYDPDGNPTTTTLGRLPDRLGHRGAQLRAGRHRDADALQPAGGQGHRRGRHDRLDPGRAERGRRRGRPPRRPAHRHADDILRGCGGPSRPHRRSRADAGLDHGQRRSSAPTTSSRGCCSPTTCATTAGSRPPTSAATRPRAAPARCTSTASR